MGHINAVDGNGKRQRLGIAVLHPDEEVGLALTIARQEHVLGRIEDLGVLFFAKPAAFSRLVGVNRIDAHKIDGPSFT